MKKGSRQLQLISDSARGSAVSVRHSKALPICSRPGAPWVAVQKIDSYIAGFNYRSPEEAERIEWYTGLVAVREQATKGPPTRAAMPSAGVQALRILYTMRPHRNVKEQDVLLGVLRAMDGTAGHIPYKIRDAIA